MITATALHGCSLIDGEWVAGKNGEITGFDPRTNASLNPSYSLANSAQLRAATTSAKRALKATDSLLQRLEQISWIPSLTTSMRYPARSCNGRAWRQVWELPDSQAK